MTRAEREARTYAIVREYTLNPKLARKARGWSAQRIKDEIGIDITRRRKPRLKPLKPTYKETALYKRRQLEIAKYQYLIGIGYTPAQANKQKRQSWKKIRDKAVVPKPKKRISDQQWASWAKSGKFPPQIRDFVERIAFQRRLDPNKRYAWFVGYKVLVEGMDYEDVLEMYKPDPFDADRYTELKRIAIQ